MVKSKMHPSNSYLIFEVIPGKGTFLYREDAENFRKVKARETPRRDASVLDNECDLSFIDKPCHFVFQVIEFIPGEDRTWTIGGWYSFAGLSVRLVGLDADKNEAECEMENGISFGCAATDLDEAFDPTEA